MASPFLTSLLRRTLAMSLTIATGILASPSFSQPSQSQSSASATPHPVLVELFTSEGCSDCPPADAVLEVLDTKQPIPGVQTIVLGEHVTYWNHQGWSDPFSFDTIDQHQDQYVRLFSLPSPATPQFVVDGSEQVAGNDPSKLRRFLALRQRPSLQCRSPMRILPPTAPSTFQ
jgi:hypothetical protein